MNSEDHYEQLKKDISTGLKLLFRLALIALIAGVLIAINLYRK